MKHGAPKNAVANFPQNDSTKLLIAQAVDSLDTVYDAMYILRGEMLRLVSPLPEFDVVMAMQGASAVTAFSFLGLTPICRFAKQEKALQWELNAGWICAIL